MEEPAEVTVGDLVVLHLGNEIEENNPQAASLSHDKEREQPKDEDLMSTVTENEAEADAEDEMKEEIDFDELDGLKEPLKVRL